MSLPTSTNDVTVRKLGSVIDGLWTKTKSTFVQKSGDTMTGKLTMEQPISQVITGTGTAATSSGSPTTYYPAKWDFDLGIANPTPGDRMVIQIPIAGSDYGVYMSTDNGTTYYPVARTTSTSRLTTHYPAKAYICVVFESYDGTDGCGKVGSIYPVGGGTARVTTTIGCWRVINDYDSGNTYERLYTGGYFYAGSTGCNPYALVCMDNTGKFSMLISSGSGTGTSKTVNTTTKFTYPATMMYYAANNTAAAGARVTSASAYIAYPGFDCRYSCNYTTTFATHSATYIECTLNVDNTWTPTTNSITQTLRSGYYYIYLGNTTSTTYAILLHTNHPLLYYNGTSLVSAELTLSSIATSSTNGNISVAGTDVTVYTHPTQTAYSAKGSATKVPKITTDSTGHVTSIEEVTITGVTPASHTHGNIANGGTLTDTAAAAAGNDYVVIRDADNSKIQTSTIKGTDVADAVSKKHSHSTITLSTTAQAYDGTHTLALPASDPYTSARTPSSHTHGNIQNGGTLQTTDITIASGDKLVVTDSSDSNKVARASVSFDGSTTTTALTPKGTFEAFAKSGDIASAINALDAEITSTDGTNVQAKVTETNGKITAVNITTDNTAYKEDSVYYVAGTTDYAAWVANHAYVVGDNVVSGGKAYTCKTAHTSGSSFATTNWNAIATPIIKGTVSHVSALFTGMKIALKWPITGGSSSTYLNINNLGNVYIRRNDSNITTHLPANTVSFLAYDGTYWRWADWDSDTTYTVHASSSTGGSTAAKTATAIGFVYTAGETFLVRFGNGNTYAGAITLNVNSQGAKPLYINGQPSSATNYSFSAGTYPVYYDGTNCYMWTDGTYEHTKVKAVSYKGLEYTNGENLVYQYVATGSPNCTPSSDHTAVTITPADRDTYFGIKFADDIAADEVISIAFDVEYTGSDDGQFKWPFKAIGQQGGITLTITGAGHYTAYGVAGRAVTKGTVENATFDDTSRVLPANSLTIKNFKFERGATATGFCLCKADSDIKVKATAKTDNVNYKILATASASPTSGDPTEAVYDADITLNPSTNTIAANISGTATSAGKLTTARKTYVTLGTASTTTTRDWSGDTTIPVDGTLAVSHGGTGVTSVTSSNFLVGNGTSAMVEKTPAQVLSLIGAQAAMTEMTTQEVTDFLTELGDF